MDTAMETLAAVAALSSAPAHGYPETRPLGLASCALPPSMYLDMLAVQLDTAGLWRDPAEEPTSKRACVGLSG
jgi:hypothetical protein